MYWVARDPSHVRVTFFSVLSASGQRKIHRITNVIGILWAPQMPVQNFRAIHPIAVEIFHSGLTNIAIPRARVAKNHSYCLTLWAGALEHHTIIQSGGFNKGKPSCCEIWMPEQNLVMAFGDTDGQVRKCHPLNLLYATKQIRQTGNGFSSACHAVSITIWFHVHVVKSPACASARYDFFLKKSIFKAWDPAENKSEQLEKELELASRIW